MKGKNNDSADLIDRQIKEINRLKNEIERLKTTIKQVVEIKEFQLNPELKKYKTNCAVLEKEVNRLNIEKSCLEIDKNQIEIDYNLLKTVSAIDKYNLQNKILNLKIKLKSIIDEVS